jgi:hypothetical protein
MAYGFFVAGDASVPNLSDCGLFPLALADLLLPHLLHGLLEIRRSRDLAQSFRRILAPLLLQKGGEAVVGRRSTRRQSVIVLPPPKLLPAPQLTRQHSQLISIHSSHISQPRSQRFGIVCWILVDLVQYLQWKSWPAAITDKLMVTPDLGVLAAVGLRRHRRCPLRLCFSR